MKVIAYIDDEEDIIECAQDYFDDETICFVATTSEKLIRELNRIDVFICDLNMPKINGVDLIKDIRKKHNCICILFSGNAEIKDELALAEIDAEQESATKIFLKPDLALVIDEAVALCKK